MSTVGDYAGRKVDVSAFQGAAPVGEVLLAQALADPWGGTAVVGVAKLAQRFLLRLLSDRGSMRFLPDAGCDFLSAVRGGRVRAQSDVFVAFAFAVGAVSRQLKAEETDADPDDERFAGAELTKVVIDVESGRLQLYIRVTSRAGDARSVILPIRASTT